MALDFPDSPTNGQVYSGFRYDSTTDAWKISSLGDLAATGGTEVTSGGYKYHTFTSSGTLTVTGSGEVEYLVIAGGGGGGTGGSYGTSGGGGGAGGLAFGLRYITAGAHTITVGTGGAPSTNGENSVFGAYVTVLGGGFGGVGNSLAPAGDGGSGGGGGGYSSTANPPGGDGTQFQGNKGAKGYGSTNADYRDGGGGGGALDMALFSGTNSGGSGGSGVLLSDWATATTTGDAGYYAGGGGGGDQAGGSVGVGGAGGGADGGNGSNGDANTGGGGGGGSTSTGGAGGSGLIIVRYAI